MASELLQALSLLPHEQAAAVVLRYFHGYTNREIAYSVGIPERTVASRLIRARGKLQSRLAGEEPSTGVFRPGRAFLWMNDVDAKRSAR